MAMTELLKSSLTDSSTDLLTRYGFDLNGCTVEQLIAHWTYLYQTHWIRQAVIEALYQGRYKAVSVEQILASWLRRGQPICHFTREFERIICNHSSKGTWPKAEFSGTAPEVDEWVTLPLDLPILACEATQAMPMEESQPPVNFNSVDSAAVDSAAVDSAAVAPAPSESVPPLLQTTTELERIGFNSMFRIRPYSTEGLAEIPGVNSAQLPEPEDREELASAEQPIVEQPLVVHGKQELPDVEQSLILEETTYLGSVDQQSVLEAMQQDQAALPDPTNKPPIHQFVPLESTSEFYTKLKAVAQGVTVGSENN